ncbi:hypothetical protein HDR63_02850 [bacterium]|nr:hypothetical protein [bacterium]
MKPIFPLVAVATALMGGARDAHAWDETFGRMSLRVTGYGTAGIFEPDFQDPDFLVVWRARAQATWAAGDRHNVGVAYAIDAIAVDDGRPMREVFGFYDYAPWGRLEFGVTDSIARKLGVGLPDVGGLRVNDQPLFYDFVHPHGPVIGDSVLTTGRRALRLNAVTTPRAGTQYGLSVAGGTDDYNVALDGAIKIRRPAGKLKTAWTAAASLMDGPDGYRADAYGPRITADWRAQAALGMNLQYNSWMLGLTARAIYDRNPVGAIGDGLAMGAGVSYDFLKYSLSATYILSDVGLWHDGETYVDHTGLVSFRYKYSPNVDGWLSVGVTTSDAFLSAGMRLTF